MKYVGFTTTKLNKRLSGHRGNIQNHTEGKIMLDHFKTHHNIIDMIIKPLEICEKKNLRARETYWMQELNTVYPYGLNNRIEINNIKNAYDHLKYNNSIPIYTLFNKVKNNRTKRGSGGQPINQNFPQNIFNAAAFVTNITNYHGTNIHKHCRSLIMTLKLQNIHTLYLYLNSHQHAFPYNEHLQHVMKDICLYRLTKSQEQEHKINNYVILNFLHKNMDNINIKKILLSPQSTERLPIPTIHLQRTGFSYKYTKTIRNIVTNYNNTVESPDWNHQCVCEQYTSYIDPDHGHVVTGNLDIITDNATRKLLLKGLNFRLPQNVDKDTLMMEYNSCLNNLIDTLSSTTRTRKKLFNPWKDFILEQIQVELDKYSFKFTARFNFDILKQIQDHFVITPVDKASKNIGIICKSFYLDILKSELQSNHFETSNIEPLTIISNYTQQLQDDYNEDVTSIPPKLPFIYWIPKFHKSPIGTRFITSGRNTAINFLSKKVALGLKHMLKIEKNYCKNKYKFTGQRYYYVIEDNIEVIEHMINQNINNHNAKFIKTFDFKTLYTDIPQQALINNVTTFITSIFNLKQNKYLNIYKKYALFSDKPNKFGSFELNDFVTQVIYLISNAYIQANDEVKKLIIGIPTGTNCASDLANIFLHIYEKENVVKLVEEHRENQLGNLGITFRFQDDLLNFNDYDINDEIITDIYPDTMTIKNTSTNNKHASYLDLEIKIINGLYTYNSYDKRRDFNFPITNFPNLHGNIPTNAAYGVFISQLIRYCRINKDLQYFISDTKNLVTRLVQQAFKKERLMNTYRTFCKKYINIWAHFGQNISTEMVINDIFS